MRGDFQGTKLGAHVWLVDIIMSLIFTSNMVKKNRNRFPLAVLLTTLIYIQYTTANLCFWFTKWNFKNLGIMRLVKDHLQQKETMWIEIDMI